MKGGETSGREARPSFMAKGNSDQNQNSNSRPPLGLILVNYGSFSRII